MTATDPLIIPFAGKTPAIADDAFVAPGAVVIGDVEIGPGASVWYGCVLRGDTNRIAIGPRTNVQDGSIIHVDAPEAGGTPVILGADVLVGHRCLLHGCSVEDEGFVGMGATMLDRSVVARGGFLAAGAFLPQGKTVPSGELWGGLPAKLLRALKPNEAAMARAGASHYVEQARAHRAALGEM